MFIVFDGIDGAGKSTQISLTRQWLTEQKFTVAHVYDPGSSELGKRLRSILLDRAESPVTLRAEMLMFMAARAQLVDELILPALNRGEIVLCDRFSFSTVVYQGHAGGLDIDQIWEANQIATAGLVPDQTLLFDLPAAAAFQRLHDRGDIPLDKMESRGPAFFEKVRSGFLAEAGRWKTGVDVIDASGDPTTVQERVRRILLNCLEKQGRVIS
jgi:dTMP kinase